MSAIDGDLREVGARLRRMREERGLSLSELARRAGVGKATLSGVETGVRNPTLDTLWAITAQLGVPIAAILGTPAESVVMRGEAVVATLLEVFEDEGVTYELYRMRVPPGGTQTSPAHHEGVTEHITVFTGTLSAGPLDSPQVAGPGGYLTWRSDVPHGYTAVGAEEVLASLLIRYPATR
ncbi:helix-turn-helix domain-containing protein [Nonomuraea dietziae]|uniref:Transcriptional regulator with XRE-family HTH domain n=1 Tax=Nonomuraea dietziae TaxID=65515 RepID=A0A7W5V1U1_9ACTN|nr:XRE family transcriptional regulator [Nonomuraea dietziae]MBB3728847.1 transcriptional regulator with XRE-family HTH domain [Nonomuraea dietziae]